MDGTSTHTHTHTCLFVSSKNTDVVALTGANLWVKACTNSTHVSHAWPHVAVLHGAQRSAREERERRPLHARRCTNHQTLTANTSPHWFARQLDGQEARHRTPCRLRHRLLALIWLHRSSFDRRLTPRQATPTQWHPCSSPTPVQGSIDNVCPAHTVQYGRRPFTPTECRRCATTQPPITHQHQLKHCAAQLRCMRIALLQALSARQTPPSFVLSTLACPRSGHTPP